MTALLFVLGITAALYLTGCILTFGRFTGSYYEQAENDMVYYNIPPSAWWNTRYKSLGYRLLFLSWIAFYTGCKVYRKYREKYFFKWSYTSLRKRFYISNL